MTVIGINLPEEVRKVKWNDLLESRRSYEYYRLSTNPQEKRIAAVDRDFYTRTLSKYVA